MSLAERILDLRVMSALALSVGLLAHAGAAQDAQVDVPVMASPSAPRIITPSEVDQSSVRAGTWNRVPRPARTLQAAMPPAIPAASETRPSL
jgi:hypothetical protein